MTDKPFKTDSEGIPILENAVDLENIASPPYEQLHRDLLKSEPVQQLILEATGILLDKFPDAPTDQLKQDATLLVQNSLEHKFPDFQESVRNQVKQDLAVYEASGRPPGRH